MNNRFLPGVPADDVTWAYKAAPGNEIESGKFDNPQSSAALVANALGWFLRRPQDLPPLPGCEAQEWPARSLMLEKNLRLPWRGGMHPWLDAVVTTPTALIGIESKRYEPFRKTQISRAYWRQVWGDSMRGYQSVRDALDDAYLYLDAAQLFKHALALRTQASGLTPILFYLYAEPDEWVSGRPVDERAKARHRMEIASFASVVEGDEVEFVSCDYATLLDQWAQCDNADVRDHAARVAEGYGLNGLGEEDGMSDNGRLGRVFADPPTESDVLGLPINGNGNHRVLKSIGTVLLAACAATAIGTVAYIAFAFGVL